MKVRHQTCRSGWQTTETNLTEQNLNKTSQFCCSSAGLLGMSHDYLGSLFLLGNSEEERREAGKGHRMFPEIHCSSEIPCFSGTLLSCFPSGCSSHMSISREESRYWLCLFNPSHPPNPSQTNAWKTQESFPWKTVSSGLKVIIIIIIWEVDTEREKENVDSFHQGSGLPHGVRFNYLSHCCCLLGSTLAESWNQELESELEQSSSDPRYGHLKNQANVCFYSTVNVLLTSYILLTTACCKYPLNYQWWIAISILQLSKPGFWESFLLI